MTSAVRRPARHVESKWRPTLVMITFAAIAIVLILPLAGLLFLRVYETQLVRQTEGELIAQAAVLSAAFADEAARAPQGVLTLGAARPPRDPSPDDPWMPIAPTLDVAAGPILPPRPDADHASAPLDPAWLELGRRLDSIAEAAQRTTLAGFRILSPDGTVIAGREEIGLSLAHIEEVDAALHGRFASVLRTRVPELPRPPIYSISRSTQIRVFVAMPVFADDRLAGVVYLSRTPQNLLSQLYQERGKVLIAALMTLISAAVVGGLFVRTINRPIRELIGRTQAIARGERDAIRPLGHHGTRELAQLTGSFLAMAERLSDRSDYIATFAAHVSHELKSPLTSIKGSAELLLDQESAMTAAERERFLANIVADAGRLTLLVERLRDLARADNPARDGVCTLREIATAMTAQFPDLAVTARGELDCALAISAENARIVLANLLDNSRGHGAAAVEIVAAMAGADLVATVADDGAGVSDSNRDKIFELFFTTRREHGGTGMGLVIVAAMLRAHGGAVRLLPSDKGATFALRIPLVA